MRRLTKMMLMGGGDGREQENARREWRITEESRRGGQGTRMGYGGEEDRYPRMGGYEGEYGRRDTRMGYEREPHRTGGYEGEESRRGGRRTRMGGYEDEDEDERGYMPRSGPEPRPANVIGFNTMPQHHERGGEQMSAEFPRHMADEWTKAMKNEDGTTGPHWTFEQAKQLMAGKGYNFDPVEFWAALNMMYSDYCKVAKKHNVNTVDFYAGLAEAFLRDKDAGEGKLRKYYEYVVK